MYFIGQKIGMTRFFLISGESICVTAIFLLPSVVCNCNTMLKEELLYKISFGHGYKVALKKSLQGEFKFLSFYGQGLYELCVSKGDVFIEFWEIFNIGFVFKEGECVNVSGFTKGKGFSGVIKRHNFKMQPATHGNSLSHRAPGSIGQCQSPGKVFKGKRMAGQFGNKVSFLKNIKVIAINVKYNFMLLKGNVPGCINSFIKIIKR